MTRTTIQRERERWLKFQKEKKVKKTIKGLKIPQIKKKEKLNYSDFLNGKYWALVRVFVLNRDNYVCKKCNSKKELQVHHISYKNHFKEHENLQDLITLCKVCHEKDHNIYRS